MYCCIAVHVIAVIVLHIYSKQLTHTGHALKKLCSEKEERGKEVTL